MDNKYYIFFCNRCCRPIDKFDTIGIMRLKNCNGETIYEKA